MANLNKVMLIGRLTFDPDPIQSGGATIGAKFRFVVTNRKQNKQTQQWEDSPCYIEVEVWNRGENKQGDRVLSSLRRGSQIYIEGSLKFDEWEDKNGGGKRNKLVVVCDNFQYLESKAEGEARLQQPPTPSRSTMGQPPALAARNGGGSGSNGGGGGRPQSNSGGGYNGNSGGGYNGGGGGGGGYGEDDYGGAPSTGGGNKGGGDDDIPF